MKRVRKHRESFMYTALIVSRLLSGAASAFAEDNAPPTIQKWRPKDGTYSGLRTDPTYDRCEDFGDVIVELAEKKIGGSEWNCNISKLTEVAPDAIRLDTVCTELEDKPYKSGFMLKKIDDSAFLYSAIINGKTSRGEKMSYCPEKMQKLFRDAKARDKAEAELKASQKREQK